MSLPSSSPAVVFLERSSPPHILTLVLLAGLSAINMNIFLPSLPSMAAYFSADYAVVQLAVSAYLGMTALLQIIMGPLSDRYGRRPVLLVTMVIFLLATIGCIFSTNITVFLIFRLLQAAIASGLALSRAIVRDMVDASRAASMIGYVTMGMAVVPMIGPVLGGILDQTFGWQASFVLTLVFGIAVFALVWADLGETNHTRSNSFSEQFGAYPELLRSRRFWGYTGTASFASGAYFAFLGGGPYVASNLLGMSPTAVGLSFGFIAAGYMLGNFLSGRFSERFGINRMMLAGSLVTVFGMLATSLLFAVGLVHAATLFGGMCLVGLGNGLTLPNSGAGMVSVKPQLAGSASGLGGALMIGGGAALSAITGALLGEGSSATPLLIMMTLAAMGGVIAAYYVIHVERSVQRAAAS